MAVSTVFWVSTRGERRASLVARREGACCLAVDHVRGNGQHGLGWDGVAVHRDGLNLFHHGVDNGSGDIIGAVVIVAVEREVTFGDVVRNQAGLVAHRGNLGVLNSSQGVGNDGQAGDAAAHGADDIGIVQRHLDCLVGVLVVGVVDDVEGFYVGANNPVQHLLVLLPNLVEVQRAVALDGLVAFDNLLAGYLIAATVDGVEQSLCGVHTSAEELHLLANFHRGDTASNCGVIAPLLTNLAVRLVLDGGGLNGDVGTEFLVALWQLRIPEDGDVWLR